ncbi:hypothetical protein RJT34_19627 [Clitoria ternatea]|uniref:Uncharacterized protein n=1 Tax=Clitoria ternatea TaxID=43366 RepID=A0AAN9IRE1_CLITE
MEMGRVSEFRIGGGGSGSEICFGEETCMWKLDLVQEMEVEEVLLATRVSQPVRKDSERMRGAHIYFSPVGFLGKFVHVAIIGLESPLCFPQMVETTTINIVSIPSIKSQNHRL